MKCREYLDLAFKLKGLRSDNQIAKALGWKHQKIANYRNGQTMSNESCRQFAEFLGIDMRIMIVDMSIERCKDKTLINKWLEIRKGFENEKL